MRYKIYKSKILAIMKVAKTLWHYVKDSQYQIIIFTNHKNFFQFIDIKIKSLR